MQEMLEAAKFYKECIEDVRKSVMLEMEQLDNSLVNFNAKAFHSPSFGDDDIVVSFCLNGRQTEVIVPVSLRSSTQMIVDKCKKCVAEKIAEYVTARITNEIMEAQDNDTKQDS